MDDGKTKTENTTTGVIPSINHIVALSSEHQPKTPAYASTQWSRKISSGIYISMEDSEHKHNQNMNSLKYVQ